MAAISERGPIFFGSKRRCFGSSTVMTTAMARATAELATREVRQSTISSRPAGMRRLVSPPTVVPAT